MIMMIVLSWLLLVPLTFLPGNDATRCIIKDLGDNLNRHLHCKELPSAGHFPKLTQAQHYSVSQFTLTNSNLTEIPNLFLLTLPNLYRLTLHNVRIQRIAPDVFLVHYPLQILELYNTQLTESVLASVDPITQLKVLNLTQNRISTLNKKCLLTLTGNLTVLDFSDNLISHIEKDTFKGLVHLEILSLHHNKLTNLDRDLFSDLVKLEELTLSKNKLVSIPTELFQNLRSLKYLLLYRNQLTNLIQNSHLYPLKQLQKLAIFKNKLTFIDMNELLNNLPNLKSIWLNNNLFDCDLVKNIMRAAFTNHSDVYLDLYSTEADNYFRNKPCHINLQEIINEDPTKNGIAPPTQDPVAITGSNLDPIPEFPSDNNTNNSTISNADMATLNEFVKEYLDKYFDQSGIFADITETLKNFNKCKEYTK